MLSDQELLQRYVRDNSEAAFTALVQRHLKVVYFSALRRVGGNSHAADDVTQKVFTALARKAKSLASRPNLAGWLHTGTRFAAAEAVRSEQRRRTHEQEAHAMSELADRSPTASEPLEPLIDEIVDRLPEHEREAVLLHVVEDLPFAEVGARLAVNPDAARMRVTRALDRLREGFARRGISSSAAALSAALSGSIGLGATAPSASAIASQAIRGTVAGNAGASTRAAFRQLLGKSSIPITALVTIAVVVVLVRPTKPPAAPQLAPAVAAPAIPLAMQSLPATEDPNGLLAAFIRETEPVAGATAGSPAANFATLPEAAQRVFKTLWNHEEDFGDPPPGMSWAFNLSTTAPEFAVFVEGRDALQNAGLARVTVKGSAAITKAGLQVGRQDRAEIDAYPTFFHIRPQPPTVPFATLAESEINILKTLWMHEQHYPSEPGRAWSFGFRQESSQYPGFAEGRLALLTRGWVRSPPNSAGVSLTPAGRMYCEAHTEEFDAAPLVYKKYGPKG